MTKITRRINRAVIGELKSGLSVTKNRYTTRSTKNALTRLTELAVANLALFELLFLEFSYR